MKNRNTYLFIFFLFLALIFLAGINFLRYSPYLAVLDRGWLIIISALIIFFILFLFIYREIENEKTIHQFIVIITHKIRTPLTGLRWIIDILEKKPASLEKGDLLMEMKKTGERLGEIIDLLVGFVRFDRGANYSFEKVSIKEIIENSFNRNSATIKGKDIHISVDAKPEVPMVRADKIKIQFAIDMLVDNSLKYTPAGGAIYAAVESGGGFVTLKIADSGIGMTYFDKKRIFRRFFRANNARSIDSGGLGLGLYVSKKIVDHCGGKMWVESEGIDKGSTFYIRLPIA